jgi:hypothetical protein
MEDDPKLIAWYKDYCGDEQVEAALKQRFVKSSDQERTADLQSISSWLKDESSSIRQRSQLMALGRSLNELHQAMRKAGR